MNISDWQQHQQAAANEVREQRNARRRATRALNKLGFYTVKQQHHRMYMGVHDEQNCRHPECLQARYARIAQESRARAGDLERRAAAALERTREDEEIPF